MELRFGEDCFCADGATKRGDNEEQKERKKKKRSSVGADRAD